MPNRAMLACTAALGLLVAGCHGRKAVVGSFPPAGPDAHYLAEAGPTSGPWQEAGRPWLATDAGGKTVLAYLVPTKTAQDLRVRWWEPGRGWSPEDTVKAGLGHALWLSVDWSEDRGPFLTWCEQSDPALGHCHPVFLHENGHWQFLAGVSAPEATHSTSQHFPVDGEASIDHYATGPGDTGTELVVRQELAPGTRSRELFRFETAQGSEDVECWSRADGTLWGAAAVRGERPGTAALIAERLGLDGRRSPQKVLDRMEGERFGLASSASREGWALLTWSAQANGAGRLKACLRSPDRWLPAVDLGPVDRKSGRLCEDLWMTGPDLRGRAALAWGRDGGLWTAFFDPAGGWTAPERQGDGADLASWASNARGERILVWGSRAASGRFHLRRWSPKTGWGPVLERTMPWGSMPEPVLADDGSGELVGLATWAGGLVRPWERPLP